MNTARFCQFHDVWGNKWSFCSEEKETGTTISSRILYWVPLPYEIDTGTLCLLQILQTRLFHSARWSGWNHLLVTLRLVCSTIMVKFYEKLWLLKKITNYWHLKFLLLIAPKRGWHLSSLCMYYFFCRYDQQNVFNQWQISANQKEEVIIYKTTWKQRRAD